MQPIASTRFRTILHDLQTNRLKLSVMEVERTNPLRWCNSVGGGDIVTAKVGFDCAGVVCGGLNRTSKNFLSIH